MSKTALIESVRRLDLGKATKLLLEKPLLGNRTDVHASVVDVAREAQASADIRGKDGVSPALRASRKRDKRYFIALAGE